MQQHNEDFVKFHEKLLEVSADIIAYRMNLGNYRTIRTENCG
jgi:hypothetical protein